MDPDKTKQEEQSDYSYSELHKEEMREIAENKPAEEKPLEEKKEEEIPLEEVGKKIAEDAANAVLEKQRLEAEESKRLEEEAAKKEPTEKEKQYIEWEKKFNEEKSRPPTYLEAMQFVEEQAIATIEAKQQARIEEESKKQEEAKKAQEADNERVNKFVDDEMEDLYNAGKLTKIVDPNNESDQGVVERKSLFAKWAEVNNERRAKGLPDIISATRIAEFYWKKPSAQTAGSNAPVMGSRSATTPPGEEEPYSYKDIHSKGWSFFKRG
jgi:hypothetical protein